MKKYSIFFNIFNGLSANTSFKRRLFYSFVLICVPILLVFTVFSYLLTTNNTRQVLAQSQMRQVEQLNTSLAFAYQGAESLSRDLVVNSNLQSYLLQMQKGSSTIIDDSELSYYIESSISNREYIDCIVLTTTSSTAYSSSRAYTDLVAFDNIQDKWWYNDMTSLENTYDWFSYATLSSSLWKRQQAKEIPTQTNSMVLARPIYNTQDPSIKIGYLMIYLDKEYMQNLWNSISWGKTTNIYLYDDFDQLVDSNQPMLSYTSLLDRFPIEDDSQIFLYNNKRYILSSVSTQFDNWHTVMITPYSELDQSFNRVILVVIILVGAMIAFIFLLSKKSAATMSRPISVLSQMINAYHGPQDKISDALVSTYLDRTDEIGDIYRSYIQLEQRMQDLIEEVYVKTLEKKDAQLALLQSQINPHFLYNTLDSINWIALMNDQEEISQMITALSNTFRLSLMKDSGYFVSLDQEINYIKSYLVLQQIRYGNRLSYEFHLPDQIEKYDILRFVLQPIIENALKHGIDKLPDGGKISISISIDKSMDLVIANDGIGIDLEKMSQLLVYHPDKSELIAFMDEGYGLQNIFRRIKIVCGNEYGLHYSLVEQQTMCHIHLPVKLHDFEKPTE